MDAFSRLSRRQWLSAASLLGLHGLAGCRHTDSGPIWIGHLARLSGKSAESAERAIDAMQLTLADLREKSFRVAGRDVGVRHVDAPTRQRARAEASRLLAVNRVVCLVVEPGIEDVTEVAAVARSHGAAVVVLGEVADPTLPDQTLLLGADPMIRGRMLARFAVAAGKGKRAVLLRDQKEPIARAVADGFAGEYRRSGGRIDYLGVEYDESRRKLYLELEKGTVLRPQILVAAMKKSSWFNGMTHERKLPPGADANPLQNLPAVYAGPLAPPMPELEEMATAREIWWPTLLPEPANLPAEGRDWAARYEKRFGQRPGDDAVLAHDAVVAITAALGAAGSGDPLELARRLTGGTEFAGLTGAIRREDGWPVRPLYLVRYVKGKRLPAEPLPGG